MKPCLATIVRRIDDAAADKDVAAVWLNINDLALGRAKISELRGPSLGCERPISRSYAELTTADTGQYLLATACDRIVMPPSGVLLIPGVPRRNHVLQGSARQARARIQRLEDGEVQGPFEPFTRTEMSKPLPKATRRGRRQLSRHAQRDRRRSPPEGLPDQNLRRSQPVLGRGCEEGRLIDEVLYGDQLEDAIKKQLKVEKLDLVTDYKKNKINVDFSGLGGMMKLIDIFTGGKPSAAVGKKPKIAVVYAVGPIMEGKSGERDFRRLVMGSTTMIAAIKEGRRRPKGGGHRAADR